MFERFLQCGVERVMLEIQYRMHPMIREFPSSQFYEHRLKDAECIALRSDKAQIGPTLSLIQGELEPVRFFDLTYSSEECSETSKVNNDEVEFIE